jgi:hypothetical protein
LCDRFFEPYPDIIGGRLSTPSNAELVSAMTLYDKGDHAKAAEELADFIAHHPQDADAAYLYLACCRLALGDPYAAELQLDFLERRPGRPFRDEVDWYNVMCMLCSGQQDRALEQATNIVNAPAHTYKNNAQELISAIGR